MGINIELENNFVITSKEELCFVLNRKKVKGEDSKLKGEEYLEKAGEYSTLQGVLNAYISKSILVSDAKSLNEIKDMLKALRTEVIGMCEIDKPKKESADHKEATKATETTKEDPNEQRLLRRRRKN